jgi:hypothetical protein
MDNTLQKRVETTRCSFILTASEYLFMRDAKVQLQSVVTEVRTYMSTLDAVHM